MTRDWKSLLQESKGLLVAILISFLLHLFLLGQSNFSLPAIDNEHFLIDARLVLPKPTISKVKPRELKKPVQPLKQEPPQAKPESEPESIIEPSEAAEELVKADPIPLPVTADAVEQETPADNSPEMVDSVPQDSGLIVNPHPYKYVETDFDVRTDINAKLDSSSVGNAKIIYQIAKSGEGYELISLIQAKGLAALVIPDLLQKSDGYFTDKGLLPMNYLYQFGDKKDRTYIAKFDWVANKLTMHTAKGDKQVVLVDGAQDLLSFMYQFMFVPPLQNMQLAITNGKKLDTYDYSFEGEEVIQTKMGDVKTIHLLRTSGEEEKDELWLALDYQYVPVKIRKTEKDNKVYELLATSLKTEKPPI